MSPQIVNMKQVTCHTCKAIWWVPIHWDTYCSVGCHTQSIEAKHESQGEGSEGDCSESSEAE